MKIIFKYYKCGIIRIDMKNFFRLFTIIIFSLYLTSCVDYVQSISYSNGKYKMYYKVTLSKAIYAMADEDPEEFFKDFDDEAFEEVPKNAIVTPVNTDLEIGVEYRFSIDPKTTDEIEKSFLPKISGNKCFIPFLFGDSQSISDSINSDSDDYEEAFAEAIMSTAKFRVLINKGVISSIETAYFEGNGKQNYSIPVYDYGNDFCLEIPFTVLYKVGMYRTDRIVVIRN